MDLTDRRSLLAKDQNAHTNALETEIDHLGYELTSNEVRLVEGVKS